MICVYPSLDVCTFLREILCTAGFNPLTTTSIEDAPILLKATKAKLVVVSPRMQIVRGKPIRQAFQEIVPDVQILTLDDNFASQDPGEAAEKLLNAVNGLLAAAS
jgi:DNA-binding NtrC family response regulator